MNTCMHEYVCISVYMYLYYLISASLVFIPYGMPTFYSALNQVCFLQYYTPFILAQVKHFLIPFVKRSYLLQDQLPGEQTGYKFFFHMHHGLITYFFHYHHFATLLYSRQKYHSWTYSNSLQVFFIVHLSHRHDSTHPSLDT